jgi:hypothetical protein
MAETRRRVGGTGQCSNVAFVTWRVPDCLDLCRGERAHRCGAGLSPSVILTLQTAERNLPAVAMKNVWFIRRTR